MKPRAYPIMKCKCPICHKIVRVSSQENSKEAEFFPFCSERCKLIDLGAWLDAEYRIGSEEQPDGRRPNHPSPDPPNGQ
jgi:hypothetical protein